MSSGPTTQDVAAWMVEEVERVRILDQEVAAYAIRRHFGDQFTYINANGNLAIEKSVLSAFRKASGDDIVWSRSERCWRHRQRWDSPGRQQQ